MHLGEFEVKIGVHLGIECKGIVSCFPFIMNDISIDVLSRTNNNDTVCLQMLTCYSIYDFVICWIMNKFK